MESLRIRDLFGIMETVNENNSMNNRQQQGQQKQPLSALGAFIRRRRLAKGWTLDDAEAASEVDRTYWSRLELGGLKQPDPRHLARIADALDAPLEDIYALAGYTAAEHLPGFKPYLRSKYHLPAEAIEQLEGYFAFLRNQYGIPADQPVFPKKDRRAKDVAQKPQGEQHGGAWDDASLGGDETTPRRAA